MQPDCSGMRGVISASSGSALGVVAVDATGSCRHWTVLVGHSERWTSYSWGGVVRMGLFVGYFIFV